jgi:hypothetical protein
MSINSRTRIGSGSYSVGTTQRSSRCLTVVADPSVIWQSSLRPPGILVRTAACRPATSAASAKAAFGTDGRQVMRVLVLGSTAKAGAAAAPLVEPGDDVVAALDALTGPVQA